MRGRAKARKNKLDLDMFRVYHTALLGHMDPKKFPMKFEDFWTDARTETTMSEEQMASNFKTWITQAAAANKEKEK